MPRTKAALAVLLATAAVLLAAGSGAANRISSSNEQWKITYSPLRFRTRPGGREINCNATLEGTLINGGVLNKIFGGQYGFVIRAATSSCGIAFLTETLSWPIYLTGFVGMLPAIAAVQTRIENFRFVWGSLFRCLYESTSTSRQPLNWFLNAAGLLTSVEMSPAWIPSTTLGCEEIEVRGTGTATIRGGATQLTMTLI